MASTLKINNLDTATGSTITVASGKSLVAPGHVINTQSVNFTGDQNTQSSSFVDINNLTLTLTPASSTSKFYVVCNIAASSNANFAFFRVVRNGTQVLTPDTVGNRATSHFAFQSYASNADPGWQMFYLPCQFLDSPNTSSNVTYKVQFRMRGDTGTAYVNRTPRNSNNSNGWDVHGVSSLTVMEIAQ